MFQRVVLIFLELTFLNHFTEKGMLDSWNWN